MTGQPCGYKFEAVLGLQHELTKVKKAAGRMVTRLSAGVGSIKPPDLAVAVAAAPGLFGGRSRETLTNEHAPHGGFDDE